MIGLNKIGLNQVQLNQLYLNTLCTGQKSSGGDGFPRLPGDVTRWSFKGLTNEMMAKNPRLEDADHKGRFLTFKNFAWSGMSGCGGYSESFSKIIINYQSEINSDRRVTITGGRSTVVNIRYNSTNFNAYIKITGLNAIANEIDEFRIYNSLQTIADGFTCKTDGIYKVEIKDTPKSQIYIWVRSKDTNVTYSSPVTIEILPIYPDALVFDGVDDYGICDNFPILTKEKGYTVVALRKWLTPEDKTNNEVLVANLKSENWSGASLGALGCEIKYNKFNPKEVRSMSFGQESIININENDPLFYQTSNNYNGVEIVKGNTTGGSYLFVGSGGASYFAKAAIWELIILDHDATEEELTKIKNYFIKTYPWLFFDQAWTVVGKSNEDTDRATIANITGNGNNLVLSNFGFAGNSGYGEYAQNFNIDKWTIATPSRVEATKTNSSFNITEVKGTAIQLYYLSTQKEVAFTIPSTKVRVTGLTDGQTINYRYFVDDVANDFLIPSDGIYNLPEFEFPAKGDYYGFNLTKVQSSCNITIEQIPDHEGYLVTDGVDDQILSSDFGIGKDFTIVGEWEFLKEDALKLAGFVKLNSFIFYNYTYLDSTNVYIYSGSGTMFNTNTVKVATSKGQVYLDFNSITEVKTGNLPDRGYGIRIGYLESNYTKLAFKNLAIYPKVLSKEDCIKAYIYLQTLKAK